MHVAATLIITTLNKLHTCNFYCPTQTLKVIMPLDYTVAAHLPLLLNLWANKFENLSPCG